MGYYNNIENRRGIQDTIGPFGDEKKNLEGENLIDLRMRNNMKIMNNFFKHKDDHRYTRYRWNQLTQQSDQRSIIDYMITSDKRIFNNVKVLPCDSLNSDHRLLIGDLNVKHIKHKQKQKGKIIKVQSLKDAEIKEKYKAAVDEKIYLGVEAAEDWETLQESIKEVAEETLGTRMVGGSIKRRHTP